MEPVGLTVGIVGLAGLFSSCLDVLQRFDDYKEFDSNSRSLAVQFETERLRFRRWGRSVGIDNKTVLDLHHPALDDAETQERAKELFAVILELEGDPSRALPSHTSGADTGLLNDRPIPTLRTQTQSAPTSHLGSKRRKIAWALGGRAKRASQVRQFATLVQLLYKLIPSDGANAKGTCGLPVITHDS